jgi:hypothetical protein
LIPEKKHSKKIIFIFYFLFFFVLFFFPNFPGAKTKLSVTRAWLGDRRLDTKFIFFKKEKTKKRNSIFYFLFFYFFPTFLGPEPSSRYQELGWATGGLIQNYYYFNFIYF